MRWGAIVVAAGRGNRFGQPKQLLPLAGKPMVAWSIALFGAMPEIVELVVVSEPDHLEPMRKLAAQYAPRLAARVVEGGETRQDSVRSGLEAISERCTGVLVHDGARPMVVASDVREAMRRVRAGTSTFLGSRVVDTIKEVAADGTVLRTLDRARLWAAETPQCAMTRELRRAHAEAQRRGIAATDDATLLERMGIASVVVPSSIDNFKITVPPDLERAENILNRRPVQPGAEEEVLLVEAFVDGAVALPVAEELTSRRGRLDSIDRDLPAAAVVRAYVPAEELHGFGDRLAVLAGDEAIFTAHHAHYVPRVTPG
jgi:2-C-methyl-D-erythritol 4-phosphate cytidylyltransferase